MAIGFYVVYSYVGDVAKASYTQALRNSLSEVRLERSVGIFVEQRVQHFFLQIPTLVKFADLYYVTVHFVLPVVILVLLFRRDGTRFRMYRNVFAILTIMGFVVYLFFPVAPPRLLPHSFGFVDTLARYGGAGKLDGYLMKEVGDPYGAMPSLHFAWAMWCTVAGLSVVRSKIARVALWIHPFLTIWVVIVTANHFIVDVVAGAVAVVLSMALAGVFGPLKRTWYRRESQLQTRRGVTFVSGVR
jgi:hypothetical protein